MKSVTSNAVAEAISYSETEHQVGTWIDGSPLYERTIVERVPANGGYGFNIPNNHKVKFWTGNFFQGSVTNPRWIMKIPYTFIDENNNTKYLTIYCFFAPGNHRFNFNAHGTYASSYYNGYAVITYKYIKS
jgi:hypothetical protein